MSTPAQTPTAPVVDPNLQTAQQIADQLAAAAAPVNNAAPTEEPSQLQREYVIQTETGQVFKGRTMQELADQMKKSVEEGSRYIQKLKQEKAAPAPPPTTTPAQFDQNQYWQMMSTDPLGAQRYALQFTPEAAQLRQQVESQQEVINAIREQSIVNQFKAENPDLPLDDTSVQKFDKEWEQAGLPLTPRNLALVHSDCLRRGIYAPAPSAAAPTSQALPNPTLTAPGASSAPPAQITQQQVNQMSAAELAAYIAQLQQ